MNKTQESFKYRYTRPCLDWFEYVDVEIQPDDYTYFRLEARFGPSWWLIGLNLKDCTWEEVQIGEIGLSDIRRFIEWAKMESYNPFSGEREKRGNRIIEIKVISGDLDIFKKAHEIMPHEAEGVE